MVYFFVSFIENRGSIYIFPCIYLRIKCFVSLGFGFPALLDHKSKKKGFKHFIIVFIVFLLSHF